MAERRTDHAVVQLSGHRHRAGDLGHDWRHLCVVEAFVTPLRTANLHIQFPLSPPQPHIALRCLGKLLQRADVWSVRLADASDEISSNRAQ